MEGERVNPGRTALRRGRSPSLAKNLPLPPLLTDWGAFLVEFQGKFLDPNEIENAGRALMALKQVRSAREFAQEFDRLAEIAGQTGQDFLLDQFRRNLKTGVQEKLLMRNFPDLQTLQVAAIEWDDMLFQFRKQQRSMEQKRPPQKTQPKPPTNGTPMDLDFTRLSQEETDKRKKAGLCFRCGKPGHVGRNCPTNTNRRTTNSQPSANYAKVAAMERSLSPISEATVVEENEPGKDFQED